MCQDCFLNPEVEITTSWLIDIISVNGEAYTLPNQEKSKVAKTLVENMFSWFEIALEVHSDHGKKYESQVFKKVGEILGIKKTKTPIYAQSDGTVERFNRP